MGANVRPYSLVERLRLPRDQYGQPPDPEAVEAAAEIERLQCQLSKLVQAFEAMRAANQKAWNVIHRCATDLFSSEEKAAMCREFIKGD